MTPGTRMGCVPMLAIVVASLVAPTTSRADAPSVKPFAHVIGANSGGPDRQMLRYAQNDAVGVGDPRDQSAEPAVAPGTAPSPPPTTAAATTTTTTLGAKGARKILVLDLRDEGIGPERARLLRDAITVRLSREKALAVLSSEDLRQVAGFEANKQALGACDESSCLTELANAMGADLIVYGNAGNLGERILINLNVFDSTRGESVGRETIDVASPDEIPAALPATLSALLAPLGVAPSTTKNPWSSPIVLGGTIVGGVGAAAALGLGGFAIALEMSAQSPGGDASLKQVAVTSGPLIVGGASAGLLVGAVGAGVALFAARSE